MITALYSVLFAMSLLYPVGYYWFVRKQRNEPWLFGLNLSICVVNLGYLLLSLSKTVGFALVANKIAYLGQVFVPLCMFMIISGLCGFAYKKLKKYALIGASLVMFGIVLTTGHLDWYYKSVELTYADGAAKLIKEYGVLHPTNLIYVLAYFVAMLAVICISLKKNKGKSYKLVGMMFAIVFCNIGGWIFEKVVPWNFEFLAVSYIVSEFIFFFVFWILQDYIHVSDVPPPVIIEEKSSVIFVDTKERATKIEHILSNLPNNTALTSRQMDILEGILDGKSRKEIAADLHLSENTVKMHTTSLFKALKVTSREEIFALIEN